MPENGAFIRAASGDPKVYYVENGLKRWITSEESFTAHDFQWNDVVVVPPEQVAKFPDGEPIHKETTVALPSEREMLPDLIPFAAQDLRLAQENGRTVLRFSSIFWNAGRGTLDLRSHAGANLTERAGWNVVADYGDPKGEAAACARSVGVADLSCLGKIELQAAPATVASIVSGLAGGEAPELGRARLHDGVWWCRMAPSRVIAITQPEDTSRVRDALESADAASFAALVETTAAWGSNAVVGPLSRETFARTMALDLRPKTFPELGFAPVSVARTPGLMLRVEGRVVSIDPETNRLAQEVSVGTTTGSISIADDRIWVSAGAAASDHRGGTLRVTVSAVDWLDPGFAYGPFEWQILSLTNDGLVGYRRVGGIDGATLVPNLALSLPTPTDGGTTYRFQLRPGVRYSTGATVEPADVRHAIVVVGG